MLEARYGWPAAVYVDERAAPAAIYGHRAGGRTGYGYAITGGETELAIDGLVGAYRLWTSDDPGPNHVDMLELTGRAVGVWPLDAHSRWGLRVEGEVGAIYSGGLFGPIVEVAVGVDYEAFFR